jgi:hypothetical protein
MQTDQLYQLRQESVETSLATSRHNRNGRTLGRSD